ncbi:MAG: PTS IIA-like nitrogen regulatory protein PtsN [Pseudomonadota bacterium]
MELNQIITPQTIVGDLKSNSKKQVLQALAHVAAPVVGFDEHAVFETLLERERLGSTGVGNGVAIPHGKLPGTKRIVGVFARNTKPIAFDAIDDQPVDLFFMLLAPEGSGADHLKALSRIARVLRDQTTLSRLRSTHDVDMLHEVLTAQQNASAA